MCLVVAQITIRFYVVTLITHDRHIMCSVVKESLTSTAVKQAEQTGLSFGSYNILRYVYYNYIS